MSNPVAVEAVSGNARWPHIDRHRETGLGSRALSIRAIRAEAREQVTGEEQKRRCGDLYRQRVLLLAREAESRRRQTLPVNRRLVIAGLAPE